MDPILVYIGKGLILLGGTACAVVSVLLTIGLCYAIVSATRNYVRNLRVSKCADMLAKHLAALQKEYGALQQANAELRAQLHLSAGDRYEGQTDDGKPSPCMRFAGCADDVIAAARIFGAEAHNWFVTNQKPVSPNLKTLAKCLARLDEAAKALPKAAR